MLTLKEWRRAKGITQQQMADMLGVHVNTYIAMENEPGKIKVTQAYEIAKILGVAISQIRFIDNDTECSLSEVDG